MEKQSDNETTTQQTVAELFANGIIGAKLLNGDCVPDDIIPRKNSWNDPLVCSDSDEGIHLKKSLTEATLFGASSGKPTAYSHKPATLRQKISQINARMIRQHTGARLWSPDMTYRLRTQLPAGGSLCVIKFRDEDGETSSPLILVAGPTGIAHNGDILNRAQAFPQVDWADSTSAKPKFSNGADFPKGIAPMILTTEAPNREAIIKIKPSQQRFQKLLEATSPLLVADARQCGQCVCVRDWTGDLASAIDDNRTELDDEDAWISSHLWLPDVPDDNGIFIPDQHKTNLWVEGAPPSKASPQDPLWHQGSDDTSDTVGDTSPVNPAGMFVNGTPPRTPPTASTAGSAVLPRMLQFPIGCQLPVGLVMDPATIALKDFLDIIALLNDSDTADNSTCDAFASPLLAAWFEAVHLRPDLFAIQVIPYLPERALLQGQLQPSTTLNDNLIVAEWEAVSPFLWDIAFSACGTQPLLQRMQAYHHALVQDTNATPDDGTTPVFGYCHDTQMFRSFIQVRFRPPSTLAWHKKYGFDTVIEASIDAIPEFARDLATMQILTDKVNSKRDPVPFQKEIVPPSPPLDSDEEGQTEKISDWSAPALSGVFGGFLSFQTELPSPSKKRPAPGTSAPNQTPPAVPPGQGGTTPTSSSANTIAQTSGKVNQSSAGSNPPAKKLVSWKPPSVTDYRAQPKKADEWSLPISYSDRDQLPILPAGSHSHFLAVFNQLFVHQTTSNPSKSEDRTTLVFSFESATNFNVLTNGIIRRFAFYGACKLPDDTEIEVLGHHGKKFDEDSLLAPGFISRMLFSVWGPAIAKPTIGSGPWKSLQSFFIEECQQASVNRSVGPPCRIDPRFFSSEHTVSALVGGKFLSGRYLTTDQAFDTVDGLTPWHFIKSVTSFAEFDRVKVPTKGIYAPKLQTIISNIVFLLHLFFRDPAHYPFVGQGHSLFSRGSLLAGHLMFLADLFENELLLEAWKQLKDNDRRLWTLAVFRFMARLFNIFENWSKPNLADSDQCMRGSYNGNHAFVLLNPAIDAIRGNIKEQLQHWRAEVKQHITPLNLSRPIPSGSVFEEITPPALANAPPATPQLRAPPAADTQRTNRDRNNRLQRPQPDRELPQLQSGDTSTNERQSSGLQAFEGESGNNGAKATICLIQCVPGKQFISLKHLLQQCTDRVAIPTFRSRQTNFQACWRFIHKTNAGCIVPRGGRCRWTHIDLADQSTNRMNRDYWQQWKDFLAHQQVSQYVQATTEFREFLNSA